MEEKRKQAIKDLVREANQIDKQILDSIYYHEARYGLLPDCIYLGSNQYRILRDYNGLLMQAPIQEDGIVRYMGIDVHQVMALDHLGIAFKGGR